MTDIIDLIDQAITPTCASCSRPLRPDGPSPDFCDELCQEWWNNRRDAPTLMDRLTATGRANVAEAAPRLMVHRSAEGLLREMADYQRYTWTGPRLAHPLDTGAPWIRSPITPPRSTFISELLTADSLLRDQDMRAGHYHDRPTIRLTWLQWMAIRTESPATCSDLPPDYVPGPADRILGRPIEMVEDYRDSTVGQSQRSVTDGSWEITEQRPPFRQ